MARLERFAVECKFDLCDRCVSLSSSGWYNDSLDAVDSCVSNVVVGVKNSNHTYSCCSKIEYPRIASGRTVHNDVRWTGPGDLW